MDRGAPADPPEAASRPVASGREAPLPSSASRAEADISDRSCRTSGTARDSRPTGMTYSGEPSSATSTRVGRVNRPPVDMRRERGLPVPDFGAALPEAPEPPEPSPPEASPPPSPPAPLT